MILGRSAAPARARRARSAERDPEFEEGAQTEHEAFTLARLGENQRRELQQIDAAIARVDAGEYGICKDCEQEIDPRLAALPYALLCTECATRHERAALTFVSQEPPTLARRRLVKREAGAGRPAAGLVTSGRPLPPTRRSRPRAARPRRRAVAALLVRTGDVRSGLLRVLVEKALPHCGQASLRGRSQDTKSQPG